MGHRAPRGQVKPHRGGQSTGGTLRIDLRQRPQAAHGQDLGVRYGPAEEIDHASLDGPSWIQHEVVDGPVGADRDHV